MESGELVVPAGVERSSTCTETGMAGMGFSSNDEDDVEGVSNEVWKVSFVSAPFPLPLDLRSVAVETSLASDKGLDLNSLSVILPELSRLDISPDVGSVTTPPTVSSKLVSDGDEM